MPVGLLGKAYSCSMLIYVVVISFLPNTPLYPCLDWTINNFVND